MKKIDNCPNNTFDCGVSCGLSIMTQAILRILDRIDDTKKQKEILQYFLCQLHEQVNEKHIEHMNERYGWEKILEKIMKEIESK